MRVILVALMVALCAAVLVQQAVAEEEEMRCRYAGGISVGEDLCLIEDPTNDPSQCFITCLSRNLRPPSPRMAMMMSIPGYCLCSSDDDNDGDHDGDNGYDDKR